jgi:hypothetical protein
LPPFPVRCRFPGAAAIRRGQAAGYPAGRQRLDVGCDYRYCVNAGVEGG